MRNTSQISRLIIGALIVLASIICVFAGCKPKSGQIASSVPAPSAGQETAPEKKLFTIVVSDDFMRELVYRFFRSRVKAAPYLIVKPGINPLTYVPTREDEQQMLAADLVLYSGLGLEPGVEKLIEKIKTKVRCEAVTANLKKEELLPSRDYPSGYDPHFWWDPGLWEKILYRVTRIFEDIDTYGAYDYGFTYARYGEATSLLNHRDMKVKSDQLAPATRVLITLHPAFTYFGRLYGYKTLSLYEPGYENYTQGRMDELVHYIIANKVPAIFPEYGYSDADLKTLQAEVQKRGYKVKLGEPLYSYFLAPMGEKDFLYLEAGRTMIDRIIAGLTPNPATTAGGR
jgi:ABC-type Zn uptake system ZnuABC Zn-binding protein ZnuA